MLPYSKYINMFIITLSCFCNNVLGNFRLFDLIKTFELSLHFKALSYLINIQNVNAKEKLQLG